MADDKRYCEVCGKEIPNRGKFRYCSNRCKQIAWRRAHGEETGKYQTLPPYRNKPESSN